MRRLGLLGCIVLGLVMPARLAQAVGKKVKERADVADSRAALESSPENEPGCGCNYASEPSCGVPEPSCCYTPQPSCNYTPQPSCSYTPQPSCGYTPQASCNYTRQPGCNVASEPSCNFAPEPGCNYSAGRGRSSAAGASGHNFRSQPSCGCNCAPEPTCGRSRELDPVAAMSGIWDSMMGGAGDSCGGQGSQDGCCECCRHSSGVWAMGEAMWFRYHRADGVRAGIDPPESAEFDFEITPRITAGWVRDDGLGVRGRYWEFDQVAPAVGPDEVGTDVAVKTYTIDVEVFDTFCLNCDWDLEIAAGLRYVDFLEEMHDLPPNGEGDETRFNSFTGWGGLASVELRRRIGTNGVIWVRARMAMLMADKDVFDNNGNDQELVRLRDVTVGMTELALGYDLVMPLRRDAYAFAGVQMEWQNWYNFSSGFEDTTNTEDFAGPADVGFGGFGIRAGIAR